MFVTRTESLDANTLAREKLWALKHKVNLIQAAFGETWRMTFGNHSDLGPDLAHWSEEDADINKYIPHIESRMSSLGPSPKKYRMVPVGCVNWISLRRERKSSAWIWRGSASTSRCVRNVTGHTTQRQRMAAIGLSALFTLAARGST